MRPWSQTKARAAGFTLVEVLIIAPIVIIAISGFIALIMTMVGDVMATRDRNAMTFEVRDALDRIEQDTRLSTQFLTTTNTLQAPQGSDGGTAPFSNTNSLILGTLTTDRNPVDSGRQLVFYAKQPNDCGAQESYNRPFISKIIYYLKDNSLWRRTYLLPYNTTSPANDETLCAIPWQLNSCSPGYLPSTRCQTNDLELMRNVDTFNIKYYTSPQSTTDIGASNALNAGSIEATLTGKKSIAGRSVAQSGSIRVSKLNNIDADLPIPNTPNVTGHLSNPDVATFTWDAVPSATSYLVSYSRNGGTWTAPTNIGSGTSFPIPERVYRNDTVSIRVQARNASGTSATWGEAATTVPAWNVCDLKNGWANYELGYATAGYTKTNSDVVVLKGLIRSGATVANTPMCILPDGFRPASRMVFRTSSLSGSVSGTSRVDVAPNGEVRFVTGSNGWVSLDGIRFVTSSNTSYSWTPLTPAATTPPWTNYGADFYTAQSTIDSNGRVHVRGLVKDGVYADPTRVVTFPPNQSKSAQYTYIPASTSASFNYMGIGAGVDMKGINPGTYLSLQAMFYPSTSGAWIDLTPLFATSWTSAGLTNHASSAYTKSADGIVTLKGMVKNVTNHDGTTIAQLPPGYRPKEQLLTSCVAFGAYCRVDIKPNGDIVDTSSANNGWLSLDNISFMAEQ